LGKEKAKSEKWKAEISRTFPLLPISCRFQSLLWHTKVSAETMPAEWPKPEPENEEGIGNVGV